MVQNYNDQLLHLAEDLAQRLLPAFDTPTGTISDRFLLINDKAGIASVKL